MLRQILATTEQIWAPLYDTANGGIASYEDIYILGAFGEGRQAVQVNNQFDACCYYGLLGGLYDEEIRERVADLDSGSWEYFLDSSHDLHEISPWTQELIASTLSVPEPAEHRVVCLAALLLLFRRTALGGRQSV